MTIILETIKYLYVHIGNCQIIDTFLDEMENEKSLNDDLLATSHYNHSMHITTSWTIYT